MKDIKTKDDIKSSWLIEETYNSEDCRHYTFDDECGLKIIGQSKTSVWAKCGPCDKETCPLKIGK